MIDRPTPDLVAVDGRDRAARPAGHRTKGPTGPPGQASEAIATCRAARTHLAATVDAAVTCVRRSRQARAHPAPPAAPGRRRTAPGPAEPPPLPPLAADLVRRHLGLARHLAARYNRRGEAAEDLEQVAMLALVRAARRYDATRGVPFAGYAAPSILGELKRHFRDHAWALRVPRPLKERYLRAKAVRDEMTHESGAVPTVDALAERLGCSPEELLEAMEAGSNLRAASIEGLDPAGASRLPGADGGFDRVLDRHRLQDLLPRLDPIEQRIIHLRFGEERTQAAIARELGVSQMHISRTLQRILDKLRQGMGGR